MTKQIREVMELIRARPSSDGDGVKLLRVFGGQGPERFDPFLMLDEFGSDQPDDYRGGFPAHPHRGFETITYMLQGKMEHRDHLGNVGLLSDGGVQWMTAGRGVIHSEMPQQTEGRMHGFQLWLNLPASKKLDPAGYQDVPAAQIPVHAMNFGQLKAIAGRAAIQGKAVQGLFDKADTRALVWDLQLDPGKSVRVELEDGMTSLAYVYQGDVTSPAGRGDTRIPVHHLARFGGEGALLFSNQGEQAARVLLLAGKPLGESIAQYGPFVMNRPEEIEQAIRDFRNGELTG